MRVELLGVMSEAACASCGRPGAELVDRHVCGGCGAPQPRRADEDPFGALEAPVRFAQDLPELERRYFRLSRLLHPDRFTTAASAWRVLSLDRMSFLNEAYRTLKDPDDRRRALLARFGRGQPADGRAGSERGRKLAVAELAEQWFELQEAFLENPDSAVVRAREFGKDLDTREKAIATAIERAEILADGELTTAPDTASPALLARLDELVALLQQRAYLQSLARDLARRSPGARAGES